MQQIPNFPNYSITTDGRVWSHLCNRFLVAHMTKTGYQRIMLRVNGASKMMLVHRLVALTYLPNPENKEEVDHINRKPYNCRLENLRWSTAKENQNNKPVRRGNIAFRRDSYNCPWRFRWCSLNECHSASFKTKQEAEAMQKIVYFMRRYFRTEL